MAPCLQASMIELPDQIRIDINAEPEHIDFDFRLDFADEDPGTLDAVLYTGVYFRTHAGDGRAPPLEGGYGELFPEGTAHDLNGTLRKFLFEESNGEQVYDFMNRISLKDTYLFAFESYVDYVPQGCEAFSEDCPPALSATYAGETYVTFYDSRVDPQGPRHAVALPGTLPLALIATFGLFRRLRSI